jgi:hypothetical protein
MVFCQSDRNKANMIYSHEIYQSPNFDGMLISRASIRSKTKMKALNQNGVRSYLRLPSEFPILGDSGAFSYIGQDVPPYETGEMLDYYTRLGFDYGVSIDHLWFGGKTPQEQQMRYELSIHNAKDFITEHRRRRLSWVPVGAIQGWNADTYAAAADELVKEGYDYLGVGGLIKMSNKKIIQIMKTIRQAIPKGVRLHAFGVARPQIIAEYQRLSVTSADSASPLRKAWMDIDRGYYTTNSAYSALRVPFVETVMRQKRAYGLSFGKELAELEKIALHELRNLGANIEPALDALLAYEKACSILKKRDMRKHYERTLKEKPWQQCNCVICQELGIEVMLFRDNEKNKRRGFHNTHVFYNLLSRIQRGQPCATFWIGHQIRQLELF